MPSFDVVSELNKHELDNAVQQAQKELTTRYDFRDAEATIERTDEGLVMRANGEGRLEAALSVLREKCAKRGISMRSLDPQKPEQAARTSYRQLVKLKEGVSKEQAKSIVQFIKERKLKVQASIQGDQVRVTGKKKDELQEAIQNLRGHDFEVDLQFTNFRD